MAWNEPGKNDDKNENKGNEDGNKPNNPWGSGGNQPPDLEKVVSDFFKKIKHTFVGQNNDGGGNASSPGSLFPFLLLLIIVTIYAVWTSAHKIDQSERGVVLVFGQYSKTMQPGLNFTWPSPIAEVTKVDVKQVYSVGEEGEMLTEDKNLVYLKFGIQYRLRESEIQNYLFMLANPDDTVKHAAESAVRQVVGTNTMSHLLNENRESSITNIKEELQTMLDQYTSGIQVTNFNFKEVHPPAMVKNAFDDVVKAREDAKTYINVANEYARKQVPLAEGDALKIIQDAEAYKESILAKSEGEAQRFDLVRNQFELAPEVTKERLYLETMELVFGNTSKVIIDSNSSNNMMYLPLDQMLKNSTKQESVFLGTTTVTSPNNNNGQTYQNSTQRQGRKGR